MKVLCLEDEDELAGLVKAGLEKAGFVVDLARTMAVALSAIRENRYDLLLLDRRLPDGDGLDMIRVLRGSGSMVPVILATAQDKVAARVEGLNAGADDYLVKPFALAEGIARIHAVLRRPTTWTARTYRAGNVAFFSLDRVFQINGVPVTVARREGLLLEQLLRRAGQVITRRSLEHGLFGYDDEASDNAIEASVSRLRKRLLALEADHRIHTVRGVGYILAP